MSLFATLNTGLKKDNVCSKGPHPAWTKVCSEETRRDVKPNDAAKKPLAGEERMNPSFRILIADRNRHVREFLQREFSSAGYQCELAANGREILSRIEDPPHVLILDLEIPLIDGWQLLEAFATNKPRIPVVIHTFLGEYCNHPLFGVGRRPC